MSASYASAQLGGAPLGGLLVQSLGAAMALIFDGLSYVVSAALILTLPSVASRVERSEGSMFAQLRAGLKFVLSIRVMNATLVNATLLNFVAGAHLSLFAVYLVRDLRVPAGGVGVLLAAEGVGALLGAAAATPLARVAGSARACMVAAIVSAVGAISLPLGQGLGGIVLFALGSILFAFGVSITSTVTRTYRQLASPPELLSRVMATVRFISWGAMPVGSLVAGIVGSTWSPRGSLLMAAGFALAALALLLLSPVSRIRELMATSEVTG